MYEAMNVYSALVHSKQSNQLPCDFKDIRKCHETALDQAIGQFQAGTIGISPITTKRYLNELAVRSFYTLLRHSSFSTLEKK